MRRTGLAGRSCRRTSQPQNPRNVDRARWRLAGASSPPSRSSARRRTSTSPISVMTYCQPSSECGGNVGTDRPSTALMAAAQRRRSPRRARSELPASSFAHPTRLAASQSSAASAQAGTPTGRGGGRRRCSQTRDNTRYHAAARDAAEATRASNRGRVVCPLTTGSPLAVLARERWSECSVGARSGAGRRRGGGSGLGNEHLYGADEVDVLLDEHQDVPTSPYPHQCDQACCWRIPGRFVGCLSMWGHRIRNRVGGVWSTPIGCPRISSANQGGRAWWLGGGDSQRNRMVINPDNWAVVEALDPSEWAYTHEAQSVERLYLVDRPENCDFDPSRPMTPLTAAPTPTTTDSRTPIGTALPTTPTPGDPSSSIPLR